MNIRSLTLSALAIAGLIFVQEQSKAAAPPNPTSEPIRKTIRRYALTSANDFPQRDPSDWRLLGSNDGGRNWTVLDVRGGEVFAERHQRRVFTVTNSAAFGVYRMEIMRVRNPSGADSVQLAEIEPLGETDEDSEPVPLPWDLVTCQGENLPLETKSQLFDGRVETKWLDHATQHAGMRSSWIQWEYRPSGVVTNVAQLKVLRSRAIHGYRVRIAAVFAGYSMAKRPWLLDESGHFEMPVQTVDQGLIPGQPILVEGTTEWTNNQLRLVVSRFEPGPPPEAATPRRMALEEPFPPDHAWMWAEVEGRVEFTRKVGDCLLFDLQENDEHLEVRVLDSAAAEKRPVNGSTVRVRGLCAGLLNFEGRKVAGTLWTASLSDIAEILPAKISRTSFRTGSVPSSGTSSNSPTLSSIEEIRRCSPEELVRRPRVRVHGVVTERFGGYMQEGAAGVEVWHGNRPPEQIPSFGTFIEVEGRGDWATGHGPIVRADSLQVIGTGKLPQAERCSWSELASGRMVDQWVEIEGVVRTTDGSHLLLGCEGGQLMATMRSAPATVIKCLVDATVKVRGVCVAASDPRGRIQGMQLLVPSLEHLEVEQEPADPLSLPITSIGSLLQVRGPKEFIHRVRVEGTVTCVGDEAYFVQDATGGAMAVPRQEVMLDTTLLGSSWMFRQSARTNVVSGIDLPVAPGQRVSLIGFPEMRGYSPLLTEVLVKKLPPAEPTKAVHATVDEVLNGGLDAMLVSMEGTLVRQELSGGQTLFELVDGRKPFQALVRLKPRAAPAVPVGSRLRVTGVCQVEPAPYSGLGKSVNSFKLLIPSAAQIQVLQRAPWSDLKRVLVVTGLLAFVLALALGWIAILRRQVEERTKELLREVREHEQTESRLAAETKRVHEEIEERKRVEAEVERSHKELVAASRLAGMAEVATSVLHNVGNVLNSASVLCSLIVEHVRHSKVTSIPRLASLLKEHHSDSNRSTPAENGGESLPGYVGRLGQHLLEEQGRLLEKLNSLTESIQHVKEVVSMQQSYAKISVSGVLETIPVAEIVEDALRMHEGAMARHQVKIIRRYGPVPVVGLDRHKLLQILFNLLENARHACAQGPNPDKTVTVGIEAFGDRYLEISVADNGVGIPVENLPRIFTQHFSTRHGGHGFGLHSSLLAAQEMGGTLTAESSGPGTGARFVLRIPYTDQLLSTSEQFRNDAKP